YGPPLRGVALRQLLERGVVGYPDRDALDHKVKGWERHRDDAVRIRCEVAALARPVAAHDIELAVEPHSAHPCEVRPPVRTHRRQPNRFVGGLILQLVERA